MLGIVKIEEAIASSARPEALTETLQSCFHSSEVSQASPSRHMPDLIASIEANGSEIIAHKTPFTIARHQCEFADQWVFYQIPTLYEPARERLVVKCGRDIPVLKSGLRDSLKAVDIELNRPFYAFDSGFVETRVYHHDQRIVFVHRLCSGAPRNSGSCNDRRRILTALCALSRTHMLA